MRVFSCERCGHAVPFDALTCGNCDAPLGYVPADRDVRVLATTGDPTLYSAGGHAARWWRCLNAAWGCNWMVPAGSGDVWCRSCRLTRGRPDEGRPDAIEAWMTAEAAKRRLVHQLDTLALPIEGRSPAAPGGLAFDLVHLPGEGAVTGHLDGIVTLDLAETDDLHRHEVSEQLHEPFRTVVGHLRHEIGHHYWNRLVGQSDDLIEFRRLFGDERADYGAAMAAYYGGSTPATDAWDADRYVSGYAAAHPLEDWAETFAHYLHIVDGADTATAHGLAPGDGVDPATLEVDDLLALWRPVIEGINAVAASLGSPAVYPFEPAGLVIDKLAFVHRQVAAHSERNDFYADR